MNRYFVFWVLLVAIEVGSCSAKNQGVNYEPYTEHQFYISMTNFQDLIKIFNENMSDEEILDSYNGKCHLILHVSSEGIINNIQFARLDSFYLSLEGKERIKDRVKREITYNVEKEAREYYRLVDKPINSRVVIQGKTLVNEEQ